METNLASWIAGKAATESDPDELVHAFLGTTSIWGTECGGEAPDRQAEFAPEAGGRLAYVVHRQLDSRITTQTLGYRSGDERSALKSVYSLFRHAREAVEAEGPDARQVADLVWWMLNRDVRPFTARWHRAATKGSLERADTQRRFRAELDVLRSALRAWAGLLRSVVDGGPVRIGPQVRRTPNRDFARSLPTRDGFAMPTASIAAFSEQIQAEKGLVDAWRLQMGRPPLGDAQSVLTGLALSGGGIRSATFALGVLRQLATRVDVFGVDYLSTVSGGGYLGSLVTTAYHNGLYDKTRIGRGPLAGPPPPSVEGEAADDDSPEELASAVVGWLRGQSEVMRYDVELIRSLAGQLVRVGANGAADEYRERLEQMWLVERDDSADARDFGLVVRGGAGVSLGDLRGPGPLQIWNMAINATQMTPRMRAALRQRGADLYTVSRAGSECRLLRRAPGPAWTVGQAMALSGAACAPTTSETSSSWLKRIAGSVINLGGWVQHFQGGPPESADLWTRFKAVWGTTDASDDVAFLTDGGHVENTGVYPLLRRRCGLVLLIDGEEDGQMRFHGLTELQHLARVELGVTLDIDTTELELNEMGLSDAHYACIPIRYPSLADGTPAHDGLLLYVKLSVTGDEPRYVQSFRMDNPVFPHHSTVFEQGYDDKMFEAYLALGEHVGAELVSKDVVGAECPSSFREWAVLVADRLLQT